MNRIEFWRVWRQKSQFTASSFDDLAGARTPENTEIDPDHDLPWPQCRRQHPPRQARPSYCSWSWQPSAWSVVHSCAEHVQSSDCRASRYWHGPDLGATLVDEVQPRGINVVAIVPPAAGLLRINFAHAQALLSPRCFQDIFCRLPTARFTCASGDCARALSPQDEPEPVPVRHHRPPVGVIGWDPVRGVRAPRACATSQWRRTLPSETQ